MIDTAEQLCLDLAGKVPAADLLLRVHIADNHEILPHVLFGDITRLVVRLHSDSTVGSSEAEKWLTVILSELEAAITSGDMQLRDVIVGSFLENLDRDDPAYPKLRMRLGRAAARVLDRPNGPGGETEECCTTTPWARLCRADFMSCQRFTGESVNLYGESGEFSGNAICHRIVFPALSATGLVALALRLANPPGRKWSFPRSTMAEGTPDVRTRPPPDQLSTRC